ncbi:MAG: hypothetical protein Q9191_003652 [Dirinaria sp. TL-2023a]
MRRSQDKLIDALDCYFLTPSDQRRDAAWSIGVLEREMGRLGLSNREIATMMMILYWGSEIAPAFSHQSLDLRYLTRKCPLLNSIWLETLRLTSASASVRFITKDTTINGKVFRKGNRLMIPYRQLHFDEGVFGVDVDYFNATRFLNHPNLARSPSWRPFGGGQTLCPGRFVAQQTVLTFVAMVLHQFDLKLTGDQVLPRAGAGKPVLGVMAPLGDLIVQIKPRCQGHE